MTSPRLHVPAASTELAEALAAIPLEVGVTREFTADELDVATAAAANPPVAPLDLTALEFVTVDPEGATDLDQAFFLERTTSGYRVHYAIAWVAGFVQPGDALDLASRERGQTMYAPNDRIPLYPPVLSEGAASLLPGVDRGAYVWEFALDETGAVTSTALRVATIRSREQLTYEQVQRSLDAGDPRFELLAEIGTKRIALERARGGASLELPEIDVEFVDGAFVLERRIPLAAEGFNAQLSLMTGMAAAELMLGARVGILRSMPPADEKSIEKFRLRAVALGKPWADGVPYGEYLRSLDVSRPADLAIMHAAASLFRGAAYTPFDGALPEVTTQAAVAAPYAHATAPLRRLVDRFVLAACEAISNGREVADWVREALPTLPAIMAASNARAGQLDRAAIDTIEAAVLSTRVGDEFDAMVISAKAEAATVQLTDPAVTATCAGSLTAGQSVRVRVDVADIASRTVTLSVA